MKRYELNKTFSFRDDENREIIMRYIESAGENQRVFQGNYDNFNILSLLNMLGFDADFDYCDDESRGICACVKSLHAYEQDAPDLLAIASSLK